MIKKIIAQNTEYLYVTDPLNDDLQQIPQFYYIEQNTVHEVFNMSKIDGIRMVFTPVSMYDNEHFFLNYLCWIKSKDLDELDQKVLNETYTDNDFEFAIKARYKENIWCSECDNKFNGFEVDRGDPYLGNKGLLKEKIQLMNLNKANLKCPNCNSSLRITIIKFV